MPLGTANDFARAAGIPLDPTEALALLDEPAVPVDVGQMNDRFFLNMATGGFGSKVTADTPEEWKRMLGGGAYLLVGLTHFADVGSVYGEFSGPEFSWSGEFLAWASATAARPAAARCSARMPPSTTAGWTCASCRRRRAPSAPEHPAQRHLYGVEAVSVSGHITRMAITAPQAVDINLDASR